MNRLGWVIVACASALGAVGCDHGTGGGGSKDAGTALGDFCMPESAPLGGYDSSQVYFETNSQTCESRTCIVYHLQGFPSPASDAGQRTFCTCRCSGGTSACTCPSDMTCVDNLVTTGGAGIRGGYCVKNSVVGG